MTWHHLTEDIADEFREAQALVIEGIWSFISHRLEYKRDWQEKNRDRNREYNRRWYARLTPDQREARRLANREVVRRWYANLPEERKADRNERLRKMRAARKVAA